MPIYEYRCSACGYQNDYLQKISDPLLADCPKCGKSTLVKQVTAAGFQLKGTGWYATDFKNNGTSKPAPAKNDSKGGPGAGGGSASSESSAKSGDSDSKSGDSSGKSGESGTSSSDSASKPEKSAPAGASPAST